MKKATSPDNGATNVHRDVQKDLAKIDKKISKTLIKLDALYDDHYFLLKNSGFLKDKLSNKTKLFGTTQEVAVNQNDTDDEDKFRLLNQIHDTISSLTELLNKNPSNYELDQEIRRLRTQGVELQNRIWIKSVKDFQKATAALNDAKKAADQAITDIGKTADAINKVAVAIGWIVKIISILA